MYSRFELYSRKFPNVLHMLYDLDDKDYEDIKGQLEYNGKDALKKTQESMSNNEDKEDRIEQIKYKHDYSIIEGLKLIIEDKSFLDFPDENFERLRNSTRPEKEEKEV